MQHKGGHIQAATIITTTVVISSARMALGYWLTRVSALDRRSMWHPRSQSRHLHPNMTFPPDMRRLHPAMRQGRLPLRLIQSRHAPNATAPTIQRPKLFWGLTDSDTPVRELAARPPSPRSIAATIARQAVVDDFVGFRQYSTSAGASGSGGVASPTACVGQSRPSSASHGAGALGRRTCARTALCGGLREFVVGGSRLASFQRRDGCHRAWANGRFDWSLGASRSNFRGSLLRGTYSGHSVGC